MADVTAEYPQRDMVTCRCGRQWDRNVYSICTDCLCNLWELDNDQPQHEAPQQHDPPQEPESAGVVLNPSTFLESTAAGPTLDILVNGHLITLRAGETVALGRGDHLTTEAVFRDSKNVSRLHAEVRFDGKNLHVRDTNSSNGTFVNDQRLPSDKEYELHSPQTLRLASNVHIQIHWEK